MYSLTLLLLITFCYAAYNLFVKVSGENVGTASPVLATIGLQISALLVSLLFLSVLLRQGVAVALPSRALAYGVLAGCCIGAAEIMYFYLFRGVAGESGMKASVAIPVIVGGTIAISILVARLVMNETLTTLQWAGIFLTLTGLILLAWGTRH